ncbi:MAG: hypothetical protein PHI58_04315 [Candidatus Omnitrophica bacterium]|nr:hypothetical protein [Candidatus Omnitrophota bacterium]
MRHKSINTADGLKEMIPVIIFCLAMAVIILIPLRVMSYGFIPPDDAQRHAAKVISQKNWDEILVLRPGFKADCHPGWHAILGAVQRIGGCDQDALVFFSVIFLFILFCIIPIFFLDFPEAWLASLLAAVVFAPHLIMRLLLGRPFIFTMAVILALCFIWPRLKDKKTPYAAMGILTALVALSAWIHSTSWYLFALPVACFFIAREFRAGTRFAVSAVIGIIIGMSLTGHPFLLLKQTWTLATLAFSGVAARRLLVGEFQPFGGDALIVLFMLGLIAWRKIRGRWNIHVIDNPIFILAAAGWALGFAASRFWTDWGMPAAIFWIMAEINDLFNEKAAMASWRRAFIAFAIAVTLFLAMNADTNSRWTYNLTTEYLSSDEPKQAGWLPEPGGIVYSDDMNVFYQTFFKNPKAQWRYILGFEPVMMLPEDLAILRKIHWNFESGKAFEPWVKKMKPADRLIVRGSYNARPAISGLEWDYAATNTWVGRLPKQ